MTKEFAPTLPRNDQGWIILPDDVSWRKSIFPDECMKHPAKLHMFLLQSIYQYVSVPGDILLDPMGGSGTLMIAALEGRTVITLDIEDEFHKWQKKAYEYIRSSHLDMAPCIQIHGNCKLLLPIPCNHIIFSPPYGSAFKPPKKLTGIMADKYHVDETNFNLYAQTTGNVGLLNTFLYNQTMEKVYHLCYESLPSGGTLSVITKDITENGKRVFLSSWINRVCHQIGFKDLIWVKSLMMGGPWQDIRRSKDLETVDDEDTIVFRKE